MCGGFGEAKPVNDEVRQIVNDLKDQIAAALNTTVDSIEAQHFKTQVVAGLNYSIRAIVNGSDVATVKIHRPLPHTNAPPHVLEARLGDFL